MTVQRPLQQVNSWSELQTWIDRRLQGIERDLDDEETAKAFGMKLKITRAVLLDVSFAIRDVLQAEQDDRTAAVRADLEDAYAKAYGDDPMAAWQAEGR